MHVLDRAIEPLGAVSELAAGLGGEDVRIGPELAEIFRREGRSLAEERRSASDEGEAEAREGQGDRHAREGPAAEPLGAAQELKQRVVLAAEDVALAGAPAVGRRDRAGDDVAHGHRVEAAREDRGQAAAEVGEEQRLHHADVVGLVGADDDGRVDDDDVEARVLLLADDDLAGDLRADVGRAGGDGQARAALVEGLVQRLRVEDDDRREVDHPPRADLAGGAGRVAGALDVDLPHAQAVLRRGVDDRRQVEHLGRALEGAAQGRSVAHVGLDAGDPEVPQQRLRAVAREDDGPHLAARRSQAAAELDPHLAGGSCDNTLGAAHRRSMHRRREKL